MVALGFCFVMRRFCSTSRMGCVLPVWDTPLVMMVAVHLFSIEPVLKI